MFLITIVLQNLTPTNKKPKSNNTQKETKKKRKSGTTINKSKRKKGEIREPTCEQKKLPNKKRSINS